MGTWNLTNVPYEINDVPIADLASVMGGARPGAVIRVAEGGAPRHITLVGMPKAGVGIAVVLPRDIPIRLTLQNGCSGLYFYGGFFGADRVSPGFASTNRGIQIEAGVSRVAFIEPLIRYCSTGMQLDGISNNPTDILVRGGLIDNMRVDGIHGTYIRRVEINGTKFRDGAVGNKYCWFADGRKPIEGISEGRCTDAAQPGGPGRWQDTAHNDLVQIHKYSFDICLENIDGDVFESQGLVNFSTLPDDHYITRLRLRNCHLLNTSVHGISFSGTDIDVRDCSGVGAPGFRSRLNIGRIPGAVPPSPVYGGRNNFQTYGATSEITSSPVLTGDVVSPVIPPAIFIPAWAPTVTPPDEFTTVVPPGYVFAGGIRWDNWDGDSADPAFELPVLGTWLSASVGSWVGTSGISFEFRWKRNGTVISGDTPIWQVGALDIGATITVEARATNPYGTSLWIQLGTGATSMSVVPAA